MTRTATCSCGQLRATCDGDPVRVSICHCHACQRRTGSVFGAQARFPADRVRREGEASVYVRQGDSGGIARFSFCSRCGSTVWWEFDGAPDVVAVAVGAFADATLPAPTFSVYEVRKHGWVVVPEGAERLD